jgi:hypothetical protein
VEAYAGILSVAFVLVVCNWQQNKGTVFLGDLHGVKENRWNGQTSVWNSMHEYRAEEIMMMIRVYLCI